MEWLCGGEAEKKRRSLELRGLDPASKVVVEVREWPRQTQALPGGSWSGAPSLELWSVQGKMDDSEWMNKAWGGDDHCLWLRVHPFVQWDVPQFLPRHTCPAADQWHFSDKPLVLDTFIDQAEALAAMSRDELTRKAKLMAREEVFPIFDN